MDIVYDLLVFLHLLGMATILAGAVTQLSATSAPGGVVTLTGSAVQVLTGIALVGIASADLVDTDVNNTKIAVKLVIAVVVLLLALTAFRKAPAGRGLLFTLTGLTVINVGVAALW